MKNSYHPKHNFCLTPKIFTLRVHDEVISQYLGNYYQSFDKIVISIKQCVTSAKMLVKHFLLRLFCVSIN